MPATPLAFNTNREDGCFPCLLTLPACSDSIRKAGLFYEVPPIPYADQRFFAKVQAIQHSFSERETMLGVYPFDDTPLFPRLRRYLEDQQTLAKQGEEYVITGNRTANSNLRTQFQRILKRAMIKPWPRLFHNMRASFQTDVCEQFPVHVSAEWCGNSLAIAEKHYLHDRRTLPPSG